MSTRNTPRNINPAQRSRRVDSEDKLLKYIRTMLGEPLINVDLSDDQILLVIDDTIRKFSDFAYNGEQRIAFVIEGQTDIQDYQLDERVQAILSVSWGNSLGSLNQTSGSGISLGAFGTVGIGYVPHITMQGEVSSLSLGGGLSSTTGGVAGGVAGGPNTGGRTGADAVSEAFVIRSQIDTMNYLNAKGVNFEYNNNTKILRVFEQISGNFIVEAAIEYTANPEYDEIYNHVWIKEYAIARSKFLQGTVTGKYSQTLVGGSSINYEDMKSEGQEAMDKLEEDLLNKYSEALGIFSD